MVCFAEEFYTSCDTTLSSTYRMVIRITEQRLTSISHLIPAEALTTLMHGSAIVPEYGNHSATHDSLLIAIRWRNVS